MEQAIPAEKDKGQEDGGRKKCLERKQGEILCLVDRNLDKYNNVHKRPQKKSLRSSSLLYCKNGMRVESYSNK